MMSAIDAAYHVLIAAGEPLHSNEIAHRILAEGLWLSKGKTPGATVDARIAVDIKTQGVASRFCRTGRSVFVANPNYQQTDTPSTHESAQLARPGESIRLPDPSTLTLSFADAAERVLDQFANRLPMHYQDITRKALELGLIATAGQTPAASMYAVVLTEIDKRTKRGEPPRFTKHGKGLVGLAIWDTKDQGLAALIDQHNRATSSICMRVCTR